MSTAPTPGPWTFGHRGMDTLWIGPSHEEKPVALVPWDCDEDARDEARCNARLLANAPEVLAALIPFVKFNSSEETITITVKTADVTRARAAIAKATGVTP